MKNILEIQQLHKNCESLTKENKLLQGEIDRIRFIIESYIDAYAFKNKHIWDDDEYLKDNEPTQFTIKQILKEIDGK